MYQNTIIHSNGSKWAGEEPDSIEKLIEVLKDNTIEERFFHSFSQFEGEKGRVWYQMCPISINDDGSIQFFGNFEEVSHVFRIDTTDAELIKKLSKAIKENSGWLKYRDKNLHNENTHNLP